MEREGGDGGKKEGGGGGGKASPSRVRASEVVGANCVRLAFKR